MKVTVELTWASDDLEVFAVHHNDSFSVTIDARLSSQQVYRACADLPEVGQEVFMQWCRLVGFDPVDVRVAEQDAPTSEIPPEPVP